jgi:hypothetical protein
VNDGRSCAQCWFFVAEDEKRVSGACHRYPPKTVVFPDERGETDIKGSVWPFVQGEQWCGEFRGAN